MGVSEVRRFEAKAKSIVDEDKIICFGVFIFSLQRNYASLPSTAISL